MSSEYIFEINDALYDHETGKVCMMPKVVGALIRCKDCKYKNLSDICEYFEAKAGDYTIWHHVEDNDFCSRAERRSDETD